MMTILLAGGIKWVMETVNMHGVSHQENSQSFFCMAGMELWFMEISHRKSFEKYLGAWVCENIIINSDGIERMTNVGACYSLGSHFSPLVLMGSWPFLSSSFIEGCHQAPI